MDMINEVEAGPEGIKYPDRTATFLRNTHYLSRFDGDQSFINLEEQESNMAKERMIQEELRQMARDTGRTHAGLQANSRASTPRVSSSSSSSSSGGSDYDTMNEIDKAQKKLELEERVRKMNSARRLKLDMDALKQQELSDQYMSARGGTTTRTGGGSSSDTEYEEVPGSSDNHGGYRQRPVATLVNMFDRSNKPPKRRITKKTKPSDKF
jgi:hypothetical protein